MGDASLFPLGCPLVSLPGGTSALLWERLLSRAGNVPLSLSYVSLEHASHIEVVEDLGHDVASECLIEVVRV